jgi:AcrR family transcriptional regulator
MQREEKSERSRRAVLDAALHLFSHQGFRATTVRDIADRARVSTGNVYHHFPDKETVFRALIDEYLEIASSQRSPFMRALHTTQRFPDNIEDLGFAARATIRQYRDYLALIYVDVIEFGGTHIQKFYGAMADRFTQFFTQQGSMEEVRGRLRVSPTDALLFTARLYFNYFSLEILFGVPDPFGKGFEQMVHEIADIVRNGICKRD